jgi:hypothetical protein
MERCVRCLACVVHDPAGVGGPTDRFGAEKGDIDSADRPRRVRIPNEGRCELGAGGPAEEATFDDRRAKPQERRFIDQRLEVMADHGGDQQMDRIRTEVDRGADDPVRGRRRLGRG